MLKEYYFFFDKAGMPLAVFLCHFKGEAINLFSRLYKRNWPDSLKLGITVQREKDVPVEQWDKIHKEYKITAKTTVCKPVTVIATPQLKEIIKIKAKPVVEQGATVLESAKYLR